MRQKLFVVFIVAVLSVAFPSWAGPAGGGGPFPALLPLHVEGGRIVDQTGGVVILRGVAVINLGDYFQANPEVPSTLPLTADDFARMAELGMNSVRLVIHWSWLEPEPGRSDLAYLEQVKEAVGWARERGIYVILDMHQDAWGKYIAGDPDERCVWPFTPNIGWDGAPEWATITDGKARCKLYQRELSPAVMRAWENFWDDRDGIQERLVQTWAWVAAEFKDDPTVCGYDLLNEPNWGENYVAVAKKKMPAFHRRALEAIRAAEAGGLRKLVFFEPIAIWSAIPGQKPVPFTDDPNIVYAPHIYLGTISIDMFLFHRELIPLRRGFELAAKESAAFGTTFYNGEWGPGPGDHAWRMAALEDEYQIGSARWQWKISCGDPHVMNHAWPDTGYVPEGEMRNVVIVQCGDPASPAGIERGINPIDALILSRPYPRAFPAPARFSSDPDARALEISGDAPGADVPLLVWIPGAGQPLIDFQNVQPTSLEAVPGGWLFSGRPSPGEWRLNAQGMDK